MKVALAFFALLAGATRDVAANHCTGHGACDVGMYGFDVEFKEVDEKDCPFSKCGLFPESRRRLPGRRGSGSRRLGSDVAHGFEDLYRELNEDLEIEAAGKAKLLACGCCECCGNCVGACCAYSQDEGTQMCYDDVSEDHCVGELEGTYLGNRKSCGDEDVKCGKTACGETCDYSRNCQSGCCVESSFLDFGSTDRTRKLSSSGDGQCGDKNWCDCHDKADNDFSRFLQCMSCPFVCDEAKPIDMLKMKLKQPVQVENPDLSTSLYTTVFVRAFNNDKCEGKVLRHGEVSLDEKFHIEAPSGGKLNKDVVWCLYDPGDTNGAPIAMSKFHLSCSDDDLNGDEDCGKDQGDGKTSGSGGGERRLMNKGSKLPLFNGWTLVSLSGSGAKGGGARLSLNCEPMDMP